MAQLPKKEPERNKEFSLNGPTYIHPLLSSSLLSCFHIVPRLLLHKPNQNKISNFKNSFTQPGRLSTEIPNPVDFLQNHRRIYLFYKRV